MRLALATLPIAPMSMARIPVSQSPPAEVGISIINTPPSLLHTLTLTFDSQTAPPNCPVRCCCHYPVVETTILKGTSMYIHPTFGPLTASFTLGLHTHATPFHPLLLLYIELSRSTVLKPSLALRSSICQKIVKTAARGFRDKSCAPTYITCLSPETHPFLL